MRNASVFVLSSISEGFGNVLVEAMACGCQIVSTDCDNGPREILVGGKYGILVPVGNEDALAEGLLHVLRDHPSKDVYNRSKDFSIDVIIPKYLDLLR